VKAIKRTAKQKRLSRIAKLRKKQAEARREKFSEIDRQSMHQQPRLLFLRPDDTEHPEIPPIDSPTVGFKNSGLSRTYGSPAGPGLSSA